MRNGEPHVVHSMVLDYATKAGEVVKELLPYDRNDESRVIDEMAVLFKDVSDCYFYEEYLLELGWELVGNNDDDVTTAPIASSYRVGYLWYKHANATWRYELMVLGHGFSPLHGSALAHAVGDDGIIVHASFKCADLSDYEMMMQYMLATDMRLAQECESGYGRFCYFTDDPDTLPVYLKPRVNLRDTQ